MLHLLSYAMLLTVARTGKATFLDGFYLTPFQFQLKLFLRVGWEWVGVDVCVGVLLNQMEIKLTSVSLAWADLGNKLGLSWAMLCATKG